MRRLLAALFFTATLPTALVTAQEPLSARVGEAYRIFAQSLVPGAMLDGQYFDAVTAGIDGNWVLATALIPDANDLSSLDQRIVDICTADGPGTTRIAVSGPMAFTASRGGPANSVSVTFVYAGGATFAQQVDTTEFLTYLGLIDNENMRQAAVNSLISSTTPVMIFRPEDDILALVRTRGHTEIYARCPQDGSAGIDTAALEAALGRAFDAQFPKAKKPDVRSAFISCAVAAFVPLSAADLQVAIDSDFNPPSEEQERLNGLYPGLQDATLACARTAEEAIRGN